MKFASRDDLGKLTAHELAAYLAGRTSHGTPEIAPEHVDALQTLLDGATPDFLKTLDQQLAEAGGDASVWARAFALEKLGSPAAAADSLRSLWWTTEGEMRPVLMVATARCLLAAGRLDEAWQALANAGKTTRSAKHLRQIDRMLKQASKLARNPAKRQCRLAVLGNATLDVLKPVLRAQGFAAGIDLEIYIAPFNQVVQEVRQPGSGLDRFAPEAVLFTMDWRWPGFGEEAQDSSAVTSVLQELQGLWRACQQRWSAQVLQCNFEIPSQSETGALSSVLPLGRSRLLRRLNLELWDAASAQPGVTIVDVEQCSAAFGREQWSDPVLWHVAKQHPAPAAIPALGAEVVAVLRAVYGLTAKCAVLDLDGTLWGGVIGEDGLGGIQLGGTAAGEAFVTFQRYLIELSHSGVLLAVCSKNNDEDARQPFRQHPEMILKESDIALFCANWQTKDQNLRSIAKDLNIGIDSLVFIDDNPAERARVRQLVPEVEVIELPQDPALYPGAISRRRLFDKLTVTSEDRARTQSIQQNLERQKLMESTGGSENLDEYLAGLNLVVDLFPFDEPNLARITQLINKTNQFNLTTRRRTEAELRALMADGWYTQAMRLSDRLGDSGLTGIMLAVPEQDTMRLDTWLMSCRVMGRKVEHAMFASLVRYARARGFSKLRCEFIPTAKNVVVKDLLAELGCQLDGEQNGSTWYSWPLDRPMEVPAVIRCLDRTQAAEATQEVS